MDLWGRDEHKEWKVSKTLNNGIEEKVKNRKGEMEKKKGRKKREKER